MKKFTLFVASLFIAIGAMAQSYVFEKLTLTEDMLYTNAPCTNTQWGDQFTSYTVLLDDDVNTFLHTEYANNGASLDGLDHYLRVDLGAGNEISAFKFNYTTRNSGGYDFPQKFIIAGSNEENGTYTEIGRVESGLPTSTGTAWESSLFTSETAYRYLRFMVTTTNTDRKVQGVEHNYWHMSEFGLTKAVAVATSYTVVYTYTYQGTEVAEYSYELGEGSAYPELPSLGYRLTVDGTKPEGTVNADGEFVFEVIVGEMPFEYASTYEEIGNKWYNLVMHSSTDGHETKTRTYLGAGDNTKLAWGGNRSLTNAADDYYWAFVGDPINGFRVVNKAKGEGFILSTDGTANPVMIEEAAKADGYNTAWQIDARAEVSNAIEAGDWFCLKYSDGKYMNANSANGTVNFWRSNDNGSAILAVKPLTINANADVATYFAEASFVIPGTLGAEVYYVDGTNEYGKANLVQITGTVYQGTGVVVKFDTEADVTYAPEFVSPGTTTAVEGNLLKGTTKRTLISKDAASYYVLGMKEQGVGFYKAVNGENATEFYNDAFKAYLEMPAAEATAAFYGFDWNGTTGIENVVTENGAKAIFDLTGRRVEAISAPGIYIVNGKKVLVK